MRRLSLSFHLFLFVVASVSPGWAEQLAPTWVYVPGGLPLVNPLIDTAGSVYLLCEDRYVYKLTRDGEFVWRANLLRKPVNAAVADDGFLIAGLENGQVVGVSPRGGVVFRTPRRFEEPWPPLLGMEGLLYITYPSGRIEARNRSGRLLWADTVVDGISAPPIMVGGVLVIGTRGGRLIGLDRYGRPLIDVWLGTEATALAAADSNHIIVGTAEGRILALATSGTTFWEVFTAGAVVALRIGRPSDPEAVAYATDTGEIGSLSLSGKIGRSHRLVAPPRDLFVTTQGLFVFEADGRIRSLDEVVVRELEDRPVVAVSVTPDGGFVTAAPSWEVSLFDSGTVPLGRWPTAGGGPNRSHHLLDSALAHQPASRYSEILDYLFLRDLLSSPFDSDVQRGLSEMVGRSEAGLLRGRHGYYRDLTRSLLERSSRRASPGTATVQLPFAQKALAVRLLGLLGDSESRRLLLEFSRVESQEAALALYIESFGRVAADPDGGLLERTAEIILRHSTPRIGASALQALEPLGRYSGASEFWLSVVFYLNQDQFGSAVRKAADRLLRTISEMPPILAD